MPIFGSAPCANVTGVRVPYSAPLGSTRAGDVRGGFTVNDDDREHTNVGLLRVHARGSAFDHYVVGDHAATLCGRLVWDIRPRRRRRELCASCRALYRAMTGEQQ